MNRVSENAHQKVKKKFLKMMEVLEIYGGKQNQGIIVKLKENENGSDDNIKLQKIFG